LPIFAALFAKSARSVISSTMFKLIPATAVSFLFIISSCTNPMQKERLPVYGNKDVKTTTVDGKQVTDTIYETVPDFSFVDQDSNVITNETFKDKIYVTDFVFLSCGSICPKMHVQMKRLSEKYASNPNVVFLSHTFDPDHDSLPRIKKFMDAQNIQSNKWHFVRGPEEEVLQIANQGYFMTAYRDSLTAEPGAEYQHDGWFVLVDKHRRIRSMKDGTDQFEVDKLIKDIDLLLEEKE
jgi:protein SCO1/2